MNLIAAFRQDARYALRMMRRAPAFTAVAVLSLALGIGANTAIFSLIYTLMLRTLPVQEPERLVELLRLYPGDPPLNAFPWDNYEYFRAHNNVFSALIGSGPYARGSAASFMVRAPGMPTERVPAQYVTGDFFKVLGVAPALGRLIGPQDRSGVAVVSWAYWNSKFHLDRAILGKQLIVEDVPVTIVGVAPRPFFGLQVGSRVDIWVPASIAPLLMPARPNSRKPGLQLLGRLKPGVSIAQARAEIAVLFRQSLEANIENNQFTRAMTMDVASAAAGFSHLRDAFAQPLLLLMVVVGLLLLIACTNVASMLLARGAAREREMAVRVALGAGRFRLVRQTLTEALLLSAAGSLLGILLAYFGTGVLARIMASGWEHFDLQVWSGGRPDAAVMLFAAGVGLLTGSLFGLAPALRAMASVPAASMRGGPQAGDTRLRRLLGKGLVAAQVAFSLVLLSAAALFIRYLSHLYAGLGFERDRVLLVTLDPARSGYEGDRLALAYKELLARLEAIPGVRSATLSAMTPVSGAGANRNIRVEGYQPRPGERRYVMENWIAPRYFETLGTPLRAGRDFTFADQGGPRVAIINHTMARYYFGDGSPIGKHVIFDGDDRPYEIVGVAGDAKYSETHEATPRTIYFNAFQEGRMPSHFALRTSLRPAAIAPEVRRTVRAVLKTVPVANVTTLADQVDASIVPERLITTLSGMFGVLGSLLAAIGLYGLLAYTVARRIHEIGIRMALGATARHMTGMVLADALGMVCAGLAAGVPLALWGARFAASQFPDLPPNSMLPIAAGGVAMMAVAMLAAYIPARRAARVDPLEALRHE